MKIIVFYDPITGKISRVKIGLESEFQSAIDEMIGYNYKILPIDTEVDLVNYYYDIDTDQIVKFPDKPGDSYVFNFQTKLWEFDIDASRDNKIRDITIEKEMEEYGGLVYKGNVFNSDKNEQRIVQSNATMASIDENIALEITTADLIPVILTSEELKELMLRMTEHVNKINVKYRKAMQDIKNAETEQDIDSILWQNY